MGEIVATSREQGDGIALVNRAITDIDGTKQKARRWWSRLRPPRRRCKNSRPVWQRCSRPSGLRIGPKNNKAQFKESG